MTSSTTMLIDMVSTMTNMETLEHDKSDKSMIKSQKDYLSLPLRLLNHVQVLKDRRLENEKSFNARKSLDGQACLSHERDQENIELGLKACPLWQSFWDTRCPSAIQQAYCHWLSELTRIFPASPSCPSGSSDQRTNLMDASSQELERILGTRYIPEPKIEPPTTTYDMPSVCRNFRLHLTSLIQENNPANRLSSSRTSDETHKLRDNLRVQEIHALTRSLATVYSELRDQFKEERQLEYTICGLVEHMIFKDWHSYPQTKTLWTTMRDRKPLDAVSKYLPDLHKMAH